MENKEDKITEFLLNYFEEETSTKFIEIFGKNKYISIGISKLLDELHFSEDELRKSLSIYLERIISVDEFINLKGIGCCKVS